MKTIAFIIAATTLAACGPSKEFKTEQQAWTRYEEHRKLVSADAKKCSEKFNLDTFNDEMEKYQTLAQPLFDEIDKHAKGSVQWKAAFEKWYDSDANKKFNAASEKWAKAYELVKGCYDNDLEAEKEVRKKEYLSACGKCGIPERCGKQLEENQRATAKGSQAAFVCQR